MAQKSDKLKKSSEFGAKRGEIMDQFIKALGSKIREIRSSKGFTQEIFVAKMQVKGCDITRSTFAKIEAGIRHISVFELQTIVSILQIDYNALFESIDK